METERPEESAIIPFIERTHKSWKQKLTRSLLWLPNKIRNFMMILYYRLVFYFVYKIRIWEFIVIDLKVIMALIAVVTGLFFCFYDKPLYLTYPSLTTQLYIAENALRTVSIFISIVFSFVVLSFNVFYKYFGRLTFVKFFTSPQIKFIFTLFIGTIILMLYTCGYLKEATIRDNYGDGLFVCSLVISTILVLAIIPTLILLLRSSQDRNNIEALISSFDRKWSMSYFINVQVKKNQQHLHYQRDPITLLNEIGTAAIKDFDKRSIITIKKGCIAHIKKMHADYQKKPEIHPSEFYHQVYDMVRNLFPIAIKERNEIAAIILLNMALEMEAFYITNFRDFNVNEREDHNYDGILFTVVIKEFLVKSLQFNEDNVSERIISGMRDWWASVIKIYLRERKYDFPAQERLALDPDSFMISSKYSEFDRIFEQIFAYKKYFLFKGISTFYSVLDSEILDSKNTRNTIVRLLQLNGSYKMSVFEKYLDDTSTEMSSDVYPHGHATWLESTSIKSHVPLSYELRTFELLFRKSRLNAYVINMIKAVAYHLMREFSADPNYKSILLNIVTHFDKLRSFVRTDDSDQRKEVYLLLERYLDFIYQWLPEYKIDNADVIKVIADTLAKFEFKEVFNKDLAEKGYVVRDIR